MNRLLNTARNGARKGDIGHFSKMVPEQSLKTSPIIQLMTLVAYKPTTAQSVFSFVALLDKPYY